jgi:geranylgeranyl pyrophosphate synthase
MQKEKKIIEDSIFKNIKSTISDKKLRNAIIYSVNSGKKIRPVIVTLLYKRMTNTQEIPEYILDAAIFIEYVHSASLIIDDIMDDDYYRRDKEAVHIKYGIEQSQMISIIISILSMNNLFNSFYLLNKTKKDFNPNIFFIIFNLVTELLIDIGIGQYLDISSISDYKNIGDSIKKSILKNKLLDHKTKKSINISDKIIDTIHKKTSTLFEFSFTIPWIFANYNKSDQEIKDGIQNMRQIARQFGLLFQIADDFEDVEKDMKRSGKNIAMNYVIHKNYDIAFRDYFKYRKEFDDTLEKNKLDNPVFDKILKYMDEKVKIYYKNENKKYIM